MAVDSVPDFKTSAVLPPVPGIRFRHFAGPSDYVGMNDAANAAREANGDHFITPLEGFANFYEHLHNCDKEHDLFIVEVDGQVVGYGRTEWRDEDDGRIHEVTCFLAPLWRRRGIGRAMLEALEERAAAVASNLDVAPVAFLQTDTMGDAGAVALLEESGYEPVRYFYVMVRPNLDPVPDAPMPAGLEIREVRDEHLRQIFDAADEATRDHWGWREATDNDFQLFLTEPLESDRSLWRIAWDGNEIAGQVRAFINHEENDRFGQKRGWVENILVRRPWRRRGLARALIDSSFRGLRERGMTEAALGVDVDNPSGALGLYESVGFVVDSRETVYRKPMPLG
jgi:mycothiol synthase